MIQKVTLDNVHVRFPFECLRSHIVKDIHGKCTDAEMYRMLSVVDENVLCL